VDNTNFSDEKVGSYINFVVLKEITRFCNEKVDTTNFCNEKAETATVLMKKRICSPEKQTLHTFLVKKRRLLIL